MYMASVGPSAILIAYMYVKERLNGNVLYSVRTCPSRLLRTLRGEGCMEREYSVLSSGTTD